MSQMPACPRPFPLAPHSVKERLDAVAAAIPPSLSPSIPSLMKLHSPNKPDAFRRRPEKVTVDGQARLHFPPIHCELKGELFRNI